MATPAFKYQDSDEKHLSELEPPLVLPTPSQEEEEGEVSQSFGNGQDHSQGELVQEAWSWINTASNSQ